jgi:general stress protein YciG
MAPESLEEYKARIARSGGQARAKNLTKEQRSEAARKAVQARWAKLEKKTAETKAVIDEGTKKLKKLAAQMERKKKLQKRSR